jgi:hypothetical protein
MGQGRLLLRTYIGLLTALSIAVCVIASFRLTDWNEAFALFALTFIVGSLKSRVRAGVLTSLSSVVSVASLFIAGPWGAVIASSASFLVYRPNFGMEKRLFNGAQAVLAIAVAGIGFHWTGTPVGTLVGTSAFKMTVAGLLSYSMSLTVNVLLISIVYALDTHLGLLQSARTMIGPPLVRLLGFGLLGILLAILWLGGLGIFAAALMMFPFAVGRWALGQYEAERQAHSATLAALARVVENKDLYTRGHCDRVQQGVLMIGRELQMEEARLTVLGNAGLLHDVGKVGVPTGVIRKSGSLNDAEFAAIKLHPARGLDLVGNIEFLADAYGGILHHHERMDGRGYPAGLKGEQIPYFGRIIAVADTFDAMTTSRSFRAARPVEEALAELERSKDVQLDAAVVDAFLAAVDKHGWVVPAPPPVSEVVASTDEPVFDHDDLAAAPLGPAAGGDSRAAPQESR